MTPIFYIFAKVFHCSSQCFCQALCLPRLWCVNWDCSRVLQSCPATSSHWKANISSRNKTFMTPIFINKGCCWIKTKRIIYLWSDSKGNRSGIKLPLARKNMLRLYLHGEEGQASCLCKNKDSSTLSSKSYLALTTQASASRKTPCYWRCMCRERR